MPKTNLGKWSCGLIIAFFVFLSLGRFAVISGQEGGATFFSNFVIAIPMLLAEISGLASFFTGIIAIVKRKERSVFVFLSTLIGLFILSFCLGEILVPH